MDITSFNSEHNLDKFTNSSALNRNLKPKVPLVVLPVLLIVLLAWYGG